MSVSDCHKSAFDIIFLPNLFTNSLILQNPKVHCCQDISMPHHKCFPVTFITYLLQIPKDVILSFNFQPSKLALPLRFSWNKLMYLLPTLISVRFPTHHDLHDLGILISVDPRCADFSGTVSVFLFSCWVVPVS